MLGHLVSPQGGPLMTTLDKANIDKPHETRKFRAHGHVDVVTLGDFTIGRAPSSPAGAGRRTSSRSPAPTPAWPGTSGVVVSGTMTVRSDDGSEMTYGPGDVFLMEPGHDAWTVAAAPCVLLDTGVAAYAEPGLTVAVRPPGGRLRFATAGRAAPSEGWHP